MPFIPVENVVKVVITYQDTFANEAVNVIHFSTDETAPTVSIMENILDDVATWLSAEWAAVSTNEWRAVRLEALDLTVADSWYVDRAVNIQGTSVSSGLPPQDTVAISLRSNFSGRSRRGRLYHVGLAEDSQEGGYLNATAITNLIAAYEGLRDGMILSSAEWVVVSYVSDGVPRTQGQTTGIVNIVITDAVIDSMDKRKPRPS